MNYPSDIESKLGITEVKDLLRNLCKGAPGREWIDRMQFLSTKDEVLAQLNLVNEVQSLILSETVVPLGEYDDIHGFIKNLSTEGFYLSAEDLACVKTFLNITAECIAFIQNGKHNTDELNEYFSDTTLNITLVNRIDSIVDENGNIKNNASPELAEVRKELYKSEQKLRDAASKFINWAEKQKYTESETQPTIRNGRMVVPMFAEYKRKVDGLVHDESATGQTVFFEPVELTRFNNEVKELAHREQRELIKILQEVSLVLLDEKDFLINSFHFLGELDALNAKAQFAISINGIKPELLDGPGFEWKEARHPLLMIKLAEKDQDIVTFNYELDESKTYLIISGPNAGGKSVCLTAIGLIQYLLQCGIPAPMEAKSKAGIFENIFIDIGDQQSVDNDLSTYSAHLTNMKYFLSNAKPNTLVLMDEYGTGTDPTIGGALAETMLEGLINKKCYGVVTTHYSSIKKMAENHSEVENGAMLFDADTLLPSFVLETGRAGSSYTFELARKIGIDKKVIDTARERVGTDLADYDKLLMQLETENKKLKEKMKDLEHKDSSLKKSYNELSQISGHLKNRKSDIIEEAKKEAARIIARANKEVEAAVREIKESQADKEKTKAIRSKLNERKEELNKEAEPAEQEVKIVVGDKVKIKNTSTIGEVIAITGKSAKIQSGNFISNVKLNLLVKSTKKEVKDIRRKGYLSAFDKSEFQRSVDLRGMRVGEALGEVDKLLDRALLYGEKEVRILHGKGSGSLRNAIRDYIQKFDYIESYHDENPDQGGDGITIITL